jgi:hypothetical protein
MNIKNAPILKGISDYPGRRGEAGFIVRYSSFYSLGLG